MPHKWQKKDPTKVPVLNSTILEAVRMVCEERKSLREVAKIKNLSKSALARHVKKAVASSDRDNLIFQTNLICGMVFSNEEEGMLRDYLLTASRMHYGLTAFQARTLAFEYAVALKKKCPLTWEKNKVAGYDWLKGFMDRNKELSLRSPEATSLGRASSFNKANVDSFLSNLRSVYEKYKLTPDCIYNCDETGVNTVTTPPRIIAARGEKQVGQVTSGERGEQVTVLCTVNAIGNSVPPVFIYPRVRHKDFFLKGAPPGSLALPSRTGWMSADLFLLSLDHIIRHTKCSKEHPILLLLDNHESHVNIEVINKAKENGVIMLTFPPHCSHRLQPLDVSVYAPFKSHYNRVSNDWLVGNPGKTISIYCTAELVGKAYPLALTQTNIISGFKMTGIYPFNSEPFGKEDYLMSSVTDRPLASASTSQAIMHKAVPDEVPNSSEIPDQTTITHTPKRTENEPGTSTAKPLTPEDIRPYPKAEPRKENQNRRKKGRTKILTSTPEKAAAEKEAQERLRKQTERKGKTSLFAAKRKRKCSSSESSCDDMAVMIEESDDDLNISSSASDETVQEINWAHDSVKIEINNFVLVKFCTKKSILYYVGRVCGSEYDNGFDISFMRKKGSCSTFFFPEQEDISYIEKQDIVLKLSPPVLFKGTERLRSLFSFQIDLTAYNVQ